MICGIPDCPAKADCYAMILVFDGGPAPNTNYPMCGFHCGPGHGRPNICRPIG